VTSLRPAAADGAAVGGEDAELLERVREAVVVLLAELPEAPARLRVRVRGVEMELNWETPTSPTPVPGGSFDPSAASAPAPVRVLDPDDSATGNGGRPAAGADVTSSSVTSSSVGTFYLRPEPGADPFVQVGDQVKTGQQVAIIEVMKLMIPVEADRDAVVTEVLADDGQSVEYGQPLFTLGPVN
jgi:acetyl-CoA carboxylase biotin carboxyl carrier protein